LVLIILESYFVSPYITSLHTPPSDGNTETKRTRFGGRSKNKNSKIIRE